VEIWVQRSLFDEPGLAAPSQIAVTPRPRPQRRRRPRINYSRVTRDPAVAHSHDEGTRAAHDFRLGLAAALARLSPEQREALRASLHGGGTRSAA